MSPTQRTMKYLRDWGYDVDPVERWIPNPKHPGGGFRKDWCGFADLIAFNDSYTLAIQVKGVSGHAKAVCDVVMNPKAVRFAKSCYRCVLVISWPKRKRKLKGGGWSKIAYAQIRETEVFA